MIDDNKSPFTRNDYAQATLAVRAGQLRGQEGEHSEPIYATSSFVFESAAQAAARFSYEEEGNVYSRFTNPTVKAFEQRLAAMEGAEASVATASGMSAILATMMTALSAGDHMVSSGSIFGATRLLFASVLAKYNISVDFVELADLDQWRNAITAKTKAIYFETPTNPLMEIGDIAAIADIARQANPDCKVIVDNCFCTPALQTPLSLGADVVIHSATKFIDGQGRAVGGAVVGDKDFVGEQVFGFLRTCGPCMSPFNAWIFLKGLETLSLRLNHSSDSAEKLAHWLLEQPQVEKVYYPGLDSHPQHRLAMSQQSKAGALVSFKVKGGKQQAWSVIDKTELLSITANLGDTRTTITHPATTTHARWSDEVKQASGIHDNLLRICVGLEDIDDICGDIHLS